jgi:hypothetical protein
MLSETLVNEAQKLHELYLSGDIREFYFTEDGDAVLILECNSTQEAERLLQQLPLVKQGLIGFKFLELKPYTGFQRLFRQF